VIRAMFAKIAEVSSRRIDVSVILAMIAIGWGTQHLNKVMGERVEELMGLDAQVDLARGSATEWEQRRAKALQETEQLRGQAIAAAAEFAETQSAKLGSHSTIIGRGTAPDEG